MAQTGPRIVIPNDYPPVMSDTPALESLKRQGPVDLYTSRPETGEELVARIREAHTVVHIRACCKFTAAVLQSCRSLRHLAVGGTGTDHVDLAAARAQGIPDQRRSRPTRRSAGSLRGAAGRYHGGRRA